MVGAGRIIATPSGVRFRCLKVRPHGPIVGGAMSTSLRDLVPIASTTPTPAASPASRADTGADGFATALKTASASTSGGATAPGSSPSSSSASAPASPSGEQLQAVPGAPYAKIISGADTGLYLNEAAGNPREGQAFRLEEQNGRALHIYGSGAGEQVIVVVHHSASGSGSTGASTGGSTGTTGVSTGSTTGTTGASTGTGGSTAPTTGTQTAG